MESTPKVVLVTGAIPPDAIARAISFAIDQPPDADVNEIIVRPTRRRG